MLAPAAADYENLHEITQCPQSITSTQGWHGRLARVLRRLTAIVMKSSKATRFSLWARRSRHTCLLVCYTLLARHDWFAQVAPMPKNSSKNNSRPSVLNARCLSRLVLDRIAEKWTALIIHVLSERQ